MPRTIFPALFKVYLRRHVEYVVVPVEDIVLEVARGDIIVHFWTILFRHFLFGSPFLKLRIIS